VQKGKNKKKQIQNDKNKKTRGTFGERGEKKV
jgi:hypothetical protein